jgi:hypothetical protein
MQFVGAHWVMPDEATVSFEEAMETMEFGFHFIKDTFGMQAPHVFWPIDVFGHSAYTIPLAR